MTCTINTATPILPTLACTPAGGLDRAIQHGHPDGAAAGQRPRCAVTEQLWMSKALCPQSGPLAHAFEYASSSTYSDDRAGLLPRQP